MACSFLFWPWYCPSIYGFCTFVLLFWPWYCLSVDLRLKKKKELKDRSRKSMDRQYHGQKKKEQKDRGRKSMDRQYHEQKKKRTKGQKP
jgi:hypothetical protein